MTDKMREEFETWAKSKHIPLRLASTGEYWVETSRVAWEAWQASRTAIVLPAPCPEKTLGPNPFRSNYAVGWDDCLEASKVAVGAAE